MEDLFPEPLGELSRKVQDINQAVLSTAFTRRKVEDLGVPQRQPSGIEQSIDSAVHEAGSQIIKDKLSGQDPIRAKVDEALGELVGDAIREKLKGTSKEELHTMLDGLFDDFGEKVIKPLYEKVQELEKEKGKELSTEGAIDAVMSAEAKARELLEKRGWKVESVSITRDSVEKMIREEVDKEKNRWEKETGAQVEVEKERVRATETILTNVTDRVFDVFLEPIKDKIQEAIERGAFQRKPIPGA